MPESNVSFKVSGIKLGQNNLAGCLKVLKETQEKIWDVALELALRDLQQGIQNETMMKQTIGLALTRDACMSPTEALQPSFVMRMEPEKNPFSPMSGSSAHRARHPRLQVKQSNRIEEPGASRTLRASANHLI